MVRLEKNWLKTSRTLVGLIGIFSGVALVPGLFFWFNFKDQIISDDIADWGSYGDYFGGVLNPMISFFSLFFLAIITWLIAKRDEDYRLSSEIRIKKIEALDLITTKTMELEKFVNSLHQFSFFLSEFRGKKNIANPNVVNMLNNNMNNLSLSVKGLIDLKILYEAMGLKFGFLFKYNFGCAEYKNMVTIVQKILELAELIVINSIVIGINSNEKEELVQKYNTDTNRFMILKEQFYSEYLILLNKLQMELNQ